MPVRGMTSLCRVARISCSDARVVKGIVLFMMIHKDHIT